MTVLTAKEVKEITDRCEKVAQERLRKRIEERKTRSFGQIDVDLDEERIDTLQPDEIKDLEETLDELRQQLDEAESRAGPETDMQSDIEERDRLRARIDQIEDAILVYGPRT